MSTKDTNPKDAVGATKAPLSCVPLGPLLEAGVGMLEGACKYGRHNYRTAGIRSSIYFDATIRHLFAWWEGEDVDPDSGVSHVTKAIAGLIVLRDAQMNGMVTDDRPPPSADIGELIRDLNQSVADIRQDHPNPEPPHTR